MSAVYSRDTCPHRIVADPSKIISCLSNFPSNLPEARACFHIPTHHPSRSTPNSTLEPIPSFSRSFDKRPHSSLAGMQVTLVATADRLLLKNDADCGGGSEKEDASLRTEMTLPASDLDHYELSIPLLRGVRMSRRPVSSRLTRSCCCHRESFP